MTCHHREPLRRGYYAVKRRIRPLLCLFGNHNHKMGVADKTGKPFGCMWCGKGMRKV